MRTAGETIAAQCTTDSSPAPDDILRSKGSIPAMAGAFAAVRTLPVDADAPRIDLPKNIGNQPHGAIDRAVTRKA